jgi:hypothetical protein
MVVVPVPGVDFDFALVGVLGVGVLGIFTGNSSHDNGE